MLSFELPRDQHLVTAGIGFENSLLDCSKAFISPGQTLVGHPRGKVSGNYKAFPVPNYASPGGTVPVIYWSSGFTRFEVVKWGIEDRSLRTVDYLRQVRLQSSIGFPAIIPASFVDIGPSEKPADGDSGAVRLRPRQGEYLYIACAYRTDERSTAAAVSLLACEPGPDIKAYVNWQPILIPILDNLSLRNFDFITPHNNRQFVAPSPQGTLLVERLTTPTAA
jgi:hypothetical protein